VKNALSQKELERYLWGAAILLRGYIDASDYKQYIFPLLFLKRICDVHDEECLLATQEYESEVAAVFPESHRFQIPSNAHWQDVRSVTFDVGVAIQKAMREIEKVNPQLSGVFGDSPWTNKSRLSDATLRDLIEHFSSESLSLTRVPEDELGQGYEYLIKKFADDSGHTAAEFYTNRTLVKLMTFLVEPNEGESICDPTCGTGGMLLVAALQLKERGKEYRSLKLYGQDVNLITSSIARMNLFLHGIDDFDIVRGDTLTSPGFIEQDQLKTFDVVLANPPYSIKQWNRDEFASDPYGRNFLGVPPQGRADYAFFQHIIKSIDPKTGRCAILFPHGVLFREDEKAMRENLVRMDVVECVLGLAPNLFYGSPMKACVILCRAKKTQERKNRILFIDAANEARSEKTQSFIDQEHRDKILNAFNAFEDIEGFAKVVTNDEILSNEASLKISTYVNVKKSNSYNSIENSIDAWQQTVRNLDTTLLHLMSQLSQVDLSE